MTRLTDSEIEKEGLRYEPWEYGLFKWLWDNNKPVKFFHSDGCKEKWMAVENGKEKKYMTVVFEYSQGASLPNALSSAFKSESGLFQDARITAISLEDKITRYKR